MIDQKDTATMDMLEDQPAPEPSTDATDALTACMRLAKAIKSVPYDIAVSQIRFIATKAQWDALQAWYNGRRVDQFIVDGIVVLPEASIVVPAPAPAGTNGQG